jgi:hypothetical protein
LGLFQRYVFGGHRSSSAWEKFSRSSSQQAKHIAYVFNPTYVGVIDRRIACAIYLLAPKKGTWDLHSVNTSPAIMVYLSA